MGVWSLLFGFCFFWGLLWLMGFGGGLGVVVGWWVLVFCGLVSWWVWVLGFCGGWVGFIHGWVCVGACGGFLFGWFCGFAFCGGFVLGWMFWVGNLWF